MIDMATGNKVCEEYWPFWVPIDIIGWIKDEKEKL